MKHFSNPFKKETCPQCGKNYDYLRQNCPNCHEENKDDDPKRRTFDNNLPLGSVREIILFAIGLFGLYILAQIIGTIALLSKNFELAAGGLSGDELINAVNEYANSIELSIIMNDVTYIVIFIIMLLVIWKDNLRLLKSIINVKSLLGIVVALGMLVLSSIWSMIATKLGAETNINQSLVEKTILANPFLAVLVTGIIAPFVEELTYRVGAFTFLKRINRVLAYVVVGALFGLIHIKDFISLNEWLSYPSYLIAGIALSFAYDMFGFGASFTAHALNNLLAVVSVLIAGGE